VSNSSPLIYLARLQRLDLLRQLFEKIFIPSAVWQEIAIDGAKNPEGPQLKEARARGWIIMESLAHPQSLLDVSLSMLGAGEREAILLARDKKTLLIIDELEGRRVAARLGIACTGTLGVLVEAKLRGFIPDVRSELDRLKSETNFRFTDELFECALKQAGEFPG